LIEVHASGTSGSPYQFERFQVVQGITDRVAWITQQASYPVGIGQTCLMPVYKNQDIPIDGRRNTQAFQALLDLKIETFVCFQSLISYFT
jgi:hypothetical protein